MSTRNYLPKDNPAVRSMVQALVREKQFGVPYRAAILGRKVYEQLRADMPKRLTAWLDEDYPWFSDVTIKGCVEIAEEELARATLKLGEGRRMAGFRGVRVQDGDAVYYLKVSQILMTLDDQRAVVARYDRQVAALQSERAHAQFCLDIHERHPDAGTCGEALQLEGIQFEMVFEAAS